MKRDCNTCVYKEGSCYPSTTIFDKDKTCKSYSPDYESYIADLEKGNAELKNKLDILMLVGNTCTKGLNNKLTKAKDIIKDYMIITKGGNITVCGVPEENRCINVLKLNEQAEQFLKECK